MTRSAPLSINKFSEAQKVQFRFIEIGTFRKLNLPRRQGGLILSEVEGSTPLLLFTISCLRAAALLHI